MVGYIGKGIKINIPTSEEWNSNTDTGVGIYSEIECLIEYTKAAVYYRRILTPSKEQRHCHNQINVLNYCERIMKGSIMLQMIF